MTATAHPTADTTTNGARPRHVRVGIIGAGFAGLGMAIRLKQAGEHDFAIWEREPDIGGTWWANTYPGCQCDIPSHLYSFSFALNPNWQRTYAPQAEIEAYARDVTTRYGLVPHIHTRCAVVEAAWDDANDRWRVTTEQGEFTADVLVGAPGPLSEPALPVIDGLDTFAGTTFHTANWNHDHDLRGRRVALIGTGASAIQVGPEIQPVVGALTVFQRTPPWIVPHRDRAITAAERRLYAAVPAAQRLVRAGVYVSRELLVPGLVYRPRLLELVERMARSHLARQVPDVDLRRRLTPDYAIGCKRIVPSNRWYPMLSKASVDVVTDGIDHVRPDGIVTTTGELHQVDTIVFATGFHVTDVLLSRRLRGTGGTLLSDHWAGSPRAYRGTAIAGFPNLFLLIGPNTGLGHNSIIFMIEAQVAYVMHALRAMRERGATRVEVTPGAEAAYNADLDRRLERTVWNTGGCASWYMDRNGRNATIWPDFTFRFWGRMRHFDTAAYELTNGARPRSGAATLAPA